MRTVLFLRERLPRAVSQAIEEALESARFEVITHRGPLALLDALERVRPEALVLDASIAGEGAFGLCRVLREVPRWQDLPIFFIADEDDVDVRIAAYRAGADDFLAAPIIAADVLARLETRLERTRIQRERADHDMLTGLLTRRAFMEHFGARLSEAARHARPLAFCLLDIDHFKSVNDTYGHLAGDRVLKRLGELLRSRFRAEDLRGRWGGEEFTIVLVGVDQRTAHKALQRLLNEFSALEFQGEDGQIFHVTFSAGIAEYPRDGIDTLALLQVADTGLLAAKRQGRNQILHSLESHPPLSP